MSLPAPACIHTISEIEQKTFEQLENKSLKVTGRLLEYEVTLSRAKLVDGQNKSSILVDTTLIEPFDVLPGNLCQVIGEVNTVSELHQPLLRARIIRSVDNLDLILYEKAIKIQQEFLGDLKE